MLFSVRTKFSAVLLALFFVGIASSVHASVDMQTYKLQPGDQITVTVIGEADLSGDYLIGGAGNIQMALLGSVPVSGITIEECRRRVGALLAADYLKDPAISVRVKELRPVYILGEVRSPGSYPFRFGLSAVAAVALAGGFGSGQRERVGRAELLRQKSDLMKAEERVSVLDRTRQSLMIRLARLEAEFAGKTSFEVSELGAFGETDAGANWLQSENETLISSLGIHHRSLELLQLQIPRLQSAIDALNEEIKANRREFELSRLRLKEYEDLTQKGLGRRSTNLDLLRDKAQLEGSMARLLAQLARLKVTKGDLLIKTQAAKKAHKLRVMRELSDTRQRLREIEAALPSARQMLALRRSTAAAGPDTGVASESFRMFLFRAENGRQQHIPVKSDQLLAPGDILEVRWANLIASEDAQRPLSSKSARAFSHQRNSYPAASK